MTKDNQDPNKTPCIDRKRKKVLEGISRGLNVSEAGRAAEPGTAQSSRRSMNRSRTHRPEAFDEIRISPEKLLKKLIKNVDATKKIYFSYRGAVVETREVPDHRIQLRALHELTKLHGLYPKRNGRTSEDRKRLQELRKLL